MNSLFIRYRTPLTTGLFLFSTNSGVELFFHWTTFAFHRTHEWLSHALPVPFALHVWMTRWGNPSGRRTTPWPPLPRMPTRKAPDFYSVFV